MPNGNVTREGSSLPNSNFKASTQTNSFGEKSFTGSGSDSGVNKVDSIDLLVDGLKAKLEKNSDDVKGWILLAKSYHYLQRWDESAEAYSKAKELGYVGGEGEFSVGSDGSAAVSGGVNESRTTAPMNGVMFAAIKEIAEQNTPPASLAVRVSLDPSLSERFPSSALLFVFVKAADGGVPVSGPPLAVVKKQVGELPLTLNLNDSMAMLPGYTISSANQVFVSARVSMSGDPIKQFNDIEKVVGPISPRSKDLISVVIGSMSGG